MSAPTDRIEITSAAPTDEAAIRALLREADLPDEDFAVHLAHFLVARAGATVVGAVGYERHGAEGLLRSLVVAPAARGGGLGGRLVAELTDRARAAGLRRFYLLTTTAEAFFRSRGYTRMDRAAVPAAIAATPEFQGLCPVSAVCLAREIGV